MAVGEVIETKASTPDGRVESSNTMVRAIVEVSGVEAVLR